MLSIDITDKQVKLVRGALNGSKIRVLEVETRDLTIGCISNGYITDIPMVAGEITDIIATRNIKEKDAIVCINSGSILYKELLVPKPKKISNSAAIEAMILNTMGITKEYNISYSIIGEAKDENEVDCYKINATACPQRMVDGYIRLFTQLGISLKQINVSNNCITRLVLNTPKLESSMPLLLVQIDNDFLNINLYEDGQLGLSRYVRIDPYDYNNEDDYVNQAVYDNLFRTIQFTSQRPGAKPIKELMFYGQVRDFIALSNSIQSFNLPAHILSIPNNIVTFCDFDFAEYANAIGAFYKVRKDYDHVNLLESSAVKEKKGSSKFLLGVGGGALGAAALVLGATLAFNAISGGIKAQANLIDAEIHSDAMRQRIDTLNAKINTLNNIELYRTNLNQADILFEYQPKPVTEIKDKLEEALKTAQSKISKEQPNDAFLVNNIEISGYGVSITVRCYSNELPTQYVRALIDQGYFEAITYSGFGGEEIPETEVPEYSFGAEEAGNVRYTFNLSMRIKGGNGYELN